MATTRPYSGDRPFDPNTFSFMKRLEEIGRFFEKRSPQHRAVYRLARQLEKAEIPYAIVGGMAVNAHGAERTTSDVDVILTSDGLTRFRETFVGSRYAPVEGRSRRFRERQTGVTVDVHVTGRWPAFGRRGPVTYPDPAAASQPIGNVRVVALDQLIQLKLAAGRYADLGDVTFLIRTHNLDESFLAQLHPSVHRDFIECLEEKRREDDYIAREG